MSKLTLPLVLAATLALPGLASARAPHFVGTPTCDVVGDQVCCSGKVAGLGTAPTSVRVDVPFACTNPGGHQPPGLASGESEPIAPRGGQITFSVCTDTATCPPPQTPTFGPTATLTILQNGNLVFSATIPVD